MQAVIAELEDLDQERSPEDLMLSYVSDKSSKDRTDRELVAPWFKFLWETYRNILDILRNNVKFTAMYGMVTKQAFQFCLQYKRNTEFRRLCEILRNQLLTLTKCAPTPCSFRVTEAQRVADLVAQEACEPYK